jgi:hypothetical protein
MFGKVKQVSQGINIDRSRTGINFNEKMDQLIPAAKIANQNTGELVGVVARENQDQYGPYQSNTFRCKVTLDLAQIDEEKMAYQDVPMIYKFGNEEEREAKLMANMQQIYKEVEELAVSE